MPTKNNSELDEILDEIYQDKNTLGDFPVDRDIAKQAILSKYISKQEVLEAINDVCLHQPSTALRLKQRLGD